MCHLDDLFISQLCLRSEELVSQLDQLGEIRILDVVSFELEYYQLDIDLISSPVTNIELLFYRTGVFTELVVL